MPRLDELPSSDEPAAEDLIPIVDVSANRTEAVTIAQLSTVLAAGDVIPNLSTISLPANTTITTFGAELVNDADAAAARTTLGAAAATDIATTVVLTQAEYDALTPDAETIYYIVN